MQNRSFDQTFEPAIACTLTPADLQERRQAWSRLARYIAASEPISGGLTFDFAAASGVRESLTELVELEAECCAWMSFATEDSGEGIRLAITGVGPDGERAVRESFAPLSAFGSQGSVTVG